MGMRQIPRRRLPHRMEVREPEPGGGYAEAKTIEHVRFERVHTTSADAHRSDSVGGKVYVDAVMSDGAFEVPVGSRAAIGGADMTVTTCTAFEGANGRVHHWELVVS